MTLARDRANCSGVKSTYTASQAQAHFPAVVRSAKRGRLVGVTEHDETVAYVVSRERMEGILDTIELLANPAFLRALKTERAGRTKYFPLDALPD